MIKHFKPHTNIPTPLNTWLDWKQNQKQLVKSSKIHITIRNNDGPINNPYIGPLALGT